MSHHFTYIHIFSYMFDNPLTNGRAHIVTALWGNPAGVVSPQIKFPTNALYFLPVKL